MTDILDFITYRTLANLYASSSNLNSGSGFRFHAHSSQPELDVELGHFSKQPAVDSRPLPGISSHQPDAEDGRQHGTTWHRGL
jgi:hypothetical protein